jgi:hypothetical protein
METQTTHTTHRSYLGRALLAGGLCLLVAGCKEHRTEYSDVKNEDAVVSEKYHRSEYRMPQRIGKITTYRTYPEVHRTTFSGDIKFVVDGSQIYYQFNENDKAHVSYREVYRDTYEDLDKDGKKEFTGRNLVDYEFVNALPIKADSTKVKGGVNKNDNQ